MRVKAGSFLPAWAWVWVLSSTITATTTPLPLTTNPLSLTTTMWTKVGVDQVSGGYLQSLGARSKLHCLLQCRARPPCSSFAFNRQSGTCFLQSGTGPTLVAPVDLGQVYSELHPMCKTAQASLVSGTAAWSHSLTSLVGKLTCDDGFINTTRDVTVECDVTGAWQQIGNCAQHVWTNPALSLFPIYVPLPVVDDWSVCIEGIPTSNNRFTVDIMAGSVNVAQQIDFRFSYGSFRNVVALGQKKGGWSSFIVQSLPVTLYQPFHLRVKATPSSTFEIYVDHTLFATRAQHPEVPASAVTSVDVRNYVNVTRVDVWCSL